MSDRAGRRLLPTAEAAAVLGVSKVTVLSYAKIGHLKGELIGRGWSFDEAAVLALRDELRVRDETWTSILRAASISGLTEYRIKEGIASGAIHSRTGPRNHPTVEVETLLGYAQQLAERPPPPPRPSPPRPPAAAGTWINSDQAAALLGLSRQRVGQLARAGLLPATRQGRFWWFRREDIELCATARHFAVTGPPVSSVR